MFDAILTSKGKKVGKSMKWLLFGSTGWIGSSLSSQLEAISEEVIRSTLHPLTFEEVKTEIQKHQPDRIICSIGRTFGPGYNTIDYLEQKGKLSENLESNLLVPVWIAQATTVPILYIGTGCIFEYDSIHTEENEEGFLESDIPNFTGSSYSTVKGTTDRLMAGFPHVINARIRMPISKDWHPRDFITKIMSYSKITSIKNSMTVLDDIFPILLATLYEGKQFGTVNAVNPGVMSHKEILRLFGKGQGDYILEPVEDQGKRLLSKRSNNCLSADLLGKWRSLLQESTRERFGLQTTLPTLRESVIKIAEYRQRNKKVLMVTGGYGFIGSNFINHWMKQNPHDFIVNIDRMDPCSDIENVVNKDPKRYIMYTIDIQETHKMKEIMARHSVTHIVHFAAETHVDNSFCNSISFTKSNVLGTHSLLEAALSYGKCKLFMHMSTDEVYGEVKEGDAAEESLLCPTNPYAATKAAAEYIVRSYGISFKLPYVIVRANNIYGPRQYPEKVIPAFITGLLKGEKIRIQGDGSAKRMFLHADDLVKGIEIILNKGQLSEIYNIGSKEEWTIQELAAYLIKKIKKTDTIEESIEYVKDRLFNDCRYSIETSKIEALGWKASRNLEESMDELIDWYKCKGSV